MDAETAPESSEGVPVPGTRLKKPVEVRALLSVLDGFIEFRLHEEE